MKWDFGWEDWRKKEKQETLLLENGFTDEENSFRDHIMELCEPPYRWERPLERRIDHLKYTRNRNS